MRPRPYQIKAVNDTLDVLFDKPGLNPIVAMPTGTGKSSVLAWTTRGILQRVPRARVFHMTHSRELVAQDSSELQTIWPNAPFGIYSAGLNQKQASMPITFSTVQSAVKNMKAFGKQSVLMIDEAQLLSPNEETIYQRAIKALREANPYMPVVGYTATPWRLGQGLLTDGNIFNHTAFDNTQKDEFVALIDDGYLCPVVPKPTTFQFDVSKVHKVAGDFNRGELEAVVNRDEHTEQALHETLQVAASRRHIMVFCSGIDHVEAVTSMLTAWGERAVAAHSKMPQGQRDAAVIAFKLGHVRWIVSEGILTTGFNSPWVDCIVLLRPTMSPGLHVQILGRGTRVFFGNGVTHMRDGIPFDQWGNCLDTADGRLASIEMSEKQNCLVLDFAGNTVRLGPINDPRIPKKKGPGTGELPVKICPSCGSYVHAAQRFCDGIHWDNTKCNHEFQFETKIEQTAATAELIVRDVPVTHWFPVDRVEYETYTRPFTPLMMRVKYFSGMRRFTEQVCIEHTTYAGKVARDWWRTRLALMGLHDVDPPPDTLTGMEFVDKLPKPTHIHVWLNAGAQGRYSNVTAVSFDGTTPHIDVKVKHTNG